MTQYVDTGEPDVPDDEVTLADGSNLADRREDLIDEIRTKAGRPSLATGSFSRRRSKQVGRRATVAAARTQVAGPGRWSR